MDRTTSKTSKRHPIPRVVVGLGALLVAFQTIAQDAAAPRTSTAAIERVNATPVNTVEEIVVTARKFRESLQDAPIAVSAFSSAGLESRAMTNLSEISKSTPSLTISTGIPSDFDVTLLGHRLEDRAHGCALTVGEDVVNGWDELGAICGMMMGVASKLGVGIIGATIGAFDGDVVGSLDRTPTRKP